MTNDTHKTIYPLSEQTHTWLSVLKDLASDDQAHHVIHGVGAHEILLDPFPVVMPNFHEAHIVASIQTNIGDWAAYLGAGSVWYVADYGNKVREEVARAFFVDVPKDLHYRL